MNPRRPSSFKVPWRLFGASIVAGLFLVLLYRGYPPGLAHSEPVLSVRDQTATVTFEVTNHNDSPMDAILFVKMGRFSPGGQYRPPRFDTFYQEKVAVVLGVAGTKQIRCTYNWKHHVPTHVEVAVLK